MARPDWSAEAARGLQLWLDKIHNESESWAKLLEPHDDDRDLDNLKDMHDQIGALHSTTGALLKHPWLVRNE